MKRDSHQKEEKEYAVSTKIHQIFKEYERDFGIRGYSSFIALCNVFIRHLEKHVFRNTIDSILEERYFIPEEILHIHIFLPRINRLVDFHMAPTFLVHYLKDAKTRYEKQEKEQKCPFVINDPSIVNCKDRHGNSALHFSAAMDFVENVENLVEQKACIDIRNNKGQTPLHYAARYGHVDIIKLLLNNGSDINAKCCEGFTPLHYASINGHIGAVKHLLKKNATMLPYVRRDNSLLLPYDIQTNFRNIQLIIEKHNIYNETHNSFSFARSLTKEKYTNIFSKSF